MKERRQPREFFVSGRTETNNESEEGGSEIGNKIIGIVMILLLVGLLVWYLWDSFK